MHMTCIVCMKIKVVEPAKDKSLAQGVCSTDCIQVIQEFYASGSRKTLTQFLDDRQITRRVRYARP